MTNNELANAFANGRTSGKSNSMFIEGDTVYSYGHHFPIARRTGSRSAEFTTRRYSVTTSRHKSAVRYALVSAGFQVVEVSL